jgi:hypothetical protein
MALWPAIPHCALNRAPTTYVGGQTRLVVARLVRVRAAGCEALPWRGKGSALFSLYPPVLPGHCEMGARRQCFGGRLGPGVIINTHRWPPGRGMHFAVPAVPAVPKVTSLRPLLQNRKTNSQYRVWVLKSPHHTHPHPEKVTKKLHGN